MAELRPSAAVAERGIERINDGNFIETAAGFTGEPPGSGGRALCVPRHSSGGTSADAGRAGGHAAEARRTECGGVELRSTETRPEPALRQGGSEVRTAGRRRRGHRRCGSRARNRGCRIALHRPDRRRLVRAVPLERGRRPALERGAETVHRRRLAGAGPARCTASEWT